MAKLLVKDLMIKNIISVRPETSLAQAGKLLSDHNFNGMPVVDEAGKLVGIITEYDMVSKGLAIHLPTFQIVLENVPVFREDRSHFKKEVAEIAALKVKDVMNDDPLTLSEDATFAEAVKVFSEHHRVNPIPIIDKSRKVIGIISRFDIFKPLALLSS